jgi:glycosyltransferase domain-containing protein
MYLMNNMEKSKDKIAVDVVLNDSANYRCTIVIPTHNRPKYLRRILSYYNEYGRNYDIIVADSSSDENKKINEKSISLFSSIDILHIKKYSSNISPYYKIADALNHVKTKYCVFCADDDFITPNGIKQSIEFLDKNQSFTVAHGIYISFYLKPDTKGKLQFHYFPSYEHIPIYYPDAKSRLFFYLSNFCFSSSLFYAVYRTDFSKMVFKEVLEFSDGDLFGEYLISALTLIYGKMKCLDVFYAARELMPDAAKRINKNLKEFEKDGTYGKKYTKFRQCLAMHLSRNSQLDVEESKRVIDNVMSLHMRKFYYSYKRILISKMRHVLNYLRLPDWMDIEIRRLYITLFVLKQIRMDDFTSSLDQPSSKYYDDFNTIRHYVLQHSKK